MVGPGIVLGAQEYCRDLNFLGASADNIALYAMRVFGIHIADHENSVGVIFVSSSASLLQVFSF